MPERPARGTRPGFLTISPRRDSGRRPLKPRVAAALFLCSLPVLTLIGSRDDSGSAVAATAAAQGVQFTDASDALGSIPETRTWGIAWADFNKDGWVDVFLNNHVNRPHMLRNQSGNAFVDVTEAVGMDDRADHHNCHWADYDNDADDDLYCTTGAKKGTGAVPANFWRRNNNSTFTDVASATNTENGPGRGRSLSWFDYDHDGDLDLFVGQYVQMPSNPISILYRNNGSTFSNVAGQAGLDVPGTAQYSAVLDYDNDGDWDLLWNYRDYTGSGFPCTPSCAVIMRNNGQGQFQPRAGNSIGLPTRARQALTVGDYDNDGDIDLFGGSKASSSKSFHMNDGNGTFDKVAASATGLDAILSKSLKQAISADFDNDGSLDIFFLMDDESSNQANMIFFGDGSGNFTNGSAGAGVQGTNGGPADVATAADFNNDGFLDLLSGYGAATTAGPYQLLRNDGNQNHWLRVRLRASPGGTALGSKIWATSDGMTQYREYADQNDGHAFHEAVAHFGLGDATNVDLLRVRWPDGSMKQMANVDADQLLTLAFDGPGGGNQSPMVLIESPANSSMYLPGDPIDFSGTAMDAEDGDLTGGLEWRSNLDGLIGMGGSFTTSALSTGTHSVTASVTDSGGRTDAANVMVIVAPPGGATLTLPDVADAFSHQGRSDVNFGTTKYMRSHGPGEKKVSFVRFGVSNLSAPVNSAILELFVAKVQDPGTVEVRPVQASWSETGLTDDNQPPFDATPVASLALRPADVGTVVSLDVTSLVQQWADSPSTAFGLAIASPDGHAQFHTREAANAPVIEVQLN